MRNKNVLIAFAVLVLVNVIFGIVMLLRGEHDTVDQRLAHSSLGLDHLGDAHHIFYTPSAHDDLRAKLPGLLSDNERAFARAVQNPATFRELDHDRQFDTLLLTGDPTTYKPLLKHLGETRDFVITWLDNAAIVFHRAGARAWSEADLQMASSDFKGENKARFLSGAAARLLAIGQIAMARRALDAAEPLGQKLPEIWTTRALYDGEIAHWKEAVAAVDRALELDPDFTPALTTKAQILFGSKRFDEALAISDKVVEKHPDDPSILFLHATISHHAHAYDREIAALKHLIALAEDQGQSTTGYRIYLGQAYAESGEAFKSLVEFKTAIAAPDASAEQKKFARDCIQKIGEKTGMQ